jgi:hypothetical protein
VDIIGGLRVPSVVVAHTVLDPTPHQRLVVEAISALADQVVVMSEAARRRLWPWLRYRPPQSQHKLLRSLQPAQIWP